MAGSAAARLMKEYRDLRKSGYTTPGKEMFVIPENDDDITRWRATIAGPKGTPYEGGEFQLLIRVPSQYPLSPPRIEFETTIFHPNIHLKTGEICLDILKSAWSPAWTLESTLRAIITLLGAPAPDSPLNCDSGNLLRSGDVRGNNSMAAMYTARHAKPSQRSSQTASQSASSR